MINQIKPYLWTTNLLELCSSTVHHHNLFDNDLLQTNLRPQPLRSFEIPRSAHNHLFDPWHESFISRNITGCTDAPAHPQTLKTHLFLRICSSVVQEGRWNSRVNRQHSRVLHCNVSLFLFWEQDKWKKQRRLFLFLWHENRGDQRRWFTSLSWHQDGNKPELVETASPGGARRGRS